jgi:hypothetical protein
VTGVACGLQNRCGAPTAPWVGSIPTRSRHIRIRSPRGLRGLSGRLRALAALALLLGSHPLCAQERPAAADGDSASAAAARDSITASDTVEAVSDATPIPDSTDAAVATRMATLKPLADVARQDSSPPVTPMGAFVRSLVVPGWGQAAVDQPGRGAFYFFAQTFFLSMAIRSQAQLDAANRAVPMDQELIDSKKGQRETWVVLAVFTALFSGVDAWVSAHLWDFEGEITPPDDGSPGVQIQVPVGGP